MTQTPLNGRHAHELESRRGCQSEMRCWLEWWAWVPWVENHEHERDAEFWTMERSRARARERRRKSPRTYVTVHAFIYARWLVRSTCCHGGESKQRFQKPQAPSPRMSLCSVTASSCTAASPNVVWIGKYIFRLCASTDTIVGRSDWLLSHSELLLPCGARQR